MTEGVETLQLIWHFCPLVILLLLVGGGILLPLSHLQVVLKLLPHLIVETIDWCTAHQTGVEG
jgi:hypothetical protein